jgi:hypothetical protein
MCSKIPDSSLAESVVVAAEGAGTAGTTTSKRTKRASKLLVCLHGLSLVGGRRAFCAARGVCRRAAAVAACAHSRQQGRLLCVHLAAMLDSVAGLGRLGTAWLGIAAAWWGFPGFARRFAASGSSLWPDVLQPDVRTMRGSGSDRLRGSVIGEARR